MEAYVHDAVLDMWMARDELMLALAEIGENHLERRVPYGSRTLKALLAHLAVADHGWAVAAQGLLKGEAEERPPLTPADARRVREDALERRLGKPPEALIEEMRRRRALLLSLYELLEPKHLALALRSYGDEHNSVRERIWVGYHDRMHAADIRRALRMNWHPPKLEFLPAVRPAVDALLPEATSHAIFSVDPTRWETPSPLPGWSNRELLMHIATGDWVLQTHLRHVIEHGATAPWPDVATGNAERIGERKHSTDRALTEEYLSMRHETFLLLSQLKPPDLDLPIQFRWEPEPNEHTVLEYLLMFERHDRTHREQLRPGMRFATARGGA